MSDDLRSYLEPVQGPIAFVLEQLRLADGRTVGEAVGGDQWIVDDVLGPVFARDEDGLPRLRLVFDELARGHWKSGVGGGIALAEVVLNDSTEVIVAAADADQARIVGDNVEGYLRRNPALSASFKVTRDTFEVPVRGSRIRVISSDAPTSWGLGGTHRRFRVICDELTQWSGPELWESLASATGKVADAQTIVLSNAGFDPGSSWQWKVRETAEREPWGHLYSPDGVIASWISAEWVEQMRALLPGPVFDRVVGNRWTTQTGDFVTAEQWRRCVDAMWTPQPRGAHGARYFAGLDLGLTRDRTALAIVHVHEDGVVLDDLMVWQGSRSDPVDVEAVERAVVDAARRFPRIRVLADPWQLAGSIQRLQRARVRIEEFTFSAGSIARLSQSLYSAVTGATLRVYDDPELEREVLGLRVVQTAGGWRVDHQAGGFSDRAIALALAVNAALEAGPRRRSAWTLGQSLSVPAEGRGGPWNADAVGVGVDASITQGDIHGSQWEKR